MEGERRRGMGEDMFEVEGRNLRRERVREVRFEEELGLGNVGRRGWEVVRGEMGDGGFDVRVEDEVFVVFGEKGVGVVVDGVNRWVEDFEGLNEGYVEMERGVIKERFVVMVRE